MIKAMTVALERRRRRNHMARMARFVAVLGLIVGSLLVSQCGSRKVLVVAGKPSLDIESALKNELGLMISMLRDAGFTPVVASASGKPFAGQTMTVKANLRLADVRVADYEGIIMPSMNVDLTTPVPPEAVRIAAEAAKAGKPIAAQRTSLRILSKAGLLKERRYAYLSPIFTEGIYSGTGVVQDGNIITSAVSPTQAQPNLPDGTPELTRMLIKSLAK